MAAPGVAPGNGAGEAPRIGLALAGGGPAAGSTRSAPSAPSKSRSTAWTSPTSTSTSGSAPAPSSPPASPTASPPAELCRAIVSERSERVLFVPATSSRRRWAIRGAGPAWSPACFVGGLWDYLRQPRQLQRLRAAPPPRPRPAGGRLRHPSRSVDFLASCSPAPGRTDDFRRSGKRWSSSPPTSTPAEPVRFGEPGLDHVPISQSGAGERRAAGALPAGRDRRPPLRRRHPAQDDARLGGTGGRGRPAAGDQPDRAGGRRRAPRRRRRGGSRQAGRPRADRRDGADPAHPHPLADGSGDEDLRQPSSRAPRAADRAPVRRLPDVLHQHLQLLRAQGGVRARLPAAPAPTCASTPAELAPKLAREGCGCAPTCSRTRSGRRGKRCARDAARRAADRGSGLRWSTASTAPSTASKSCCRRAERSRRLAPPRRPAAGRQSAAPGTARRNGGVSGRTAAATDAVAWSEIPPSWPSPPVPSPRPRAPHRRRPARRPPSRSSSRRAATACCGASSPPSVTCWASSSAASSPRFASGPKSAAAGSSTGSPGWSPPSPRLFLNRKLAAQPFPVQLRRRLEMLGPTYIKLGQVLSLRQDLLPPAITGELKNLLDRLPVVPFPRFMEIVAGRPRSAGRGDLRVDRPPPAGLRLHRPDPPRHPEDRRVGDPQGGQAGHPRHPRVATPRCSGCWDGSSSSSSPGCAPSG